MRVGIDIDDRVVNARLEALRDAGGDRRTMGDIARMMKTSTQMRFRMQQAPDGSRWFPSAAARKRAGQTLRDSNRLYRSITTRHGPTYAEAGTNVAYAAVHQFGMNQPVNVRGHSRMLRIDRGASGVSVKRVPVRAHARWMFVARRAYLGFSAADVRAILSRLERGIAEAARK